MKLQQVVAANQGRERTLVLVNFGAGEADANETLPMTENQIDEGFKAAKEGSPKAAYAPSVPTEELRASYQNKPLVEPSPSPPVVPAAEVVEPTPAHEANDLKEEDCLTLIMFLLFRAGVHLYPEKETLATCNVLKLLFACRSSSAGISSCAQNRPKSKHGDKEQ